MARATTRRARNGWLSARLFATLAMVFATLATPGAAGPAFNQSFTPIPDWLPKGSPAPTTPVPAPQPHAGSIPPPNASEERPGSLGAARAERPDAGAFRSRKLGDAQPSHSRVVPALAAVSVGLNLALIVAEVRRRRHLNRVADENTPLMY